MPTRQKNYLRSFSLIAILTFAGCAAKPNLVNGKYYMGGDSNCRKYRALSDDQIMCVNSDGQETGYRNAMSDQELQMYYYNQAEESASIGKTQSNSPANIKSNEAECL